MAEYVGPRRDDDPGASMWVGWIAFAGLMMVLLGTFHVVQGLVAEFSQDFFVVRTSGLVLGVDYSIWGWAHLATGAVILGAGFCVFAGQLWARIVGVFVAVASAVLNVAFLAAYPVLSLVMIGIDVLVVLALTVHGHDIKPTG